MEQKVSWWDEEEKEKRGKGDSGKDKRGQATLPEK